MKRVMRLGSGDDMREYEVEARGYILRDVIEGLWRFETGCREKGGA